MAAVSPGRVPVFCTQNTAIPSLPPRWVMLRKTQPPLRDHAKGPVVARSPDRATTSWAGQHGTCDYAAGVSEPSPGPAQRRPGLAGVIETSNPERVADALRGREKLRNDLDRIPPTNSVTPAAFLIGLSVRFPGVRCATPGCARKRLWRASDGTGVMSFYARPTPPWIEPNRFFSLDVNTMTTRSTPISFASCLMIERRGFS